MAKAIIRAITTDHLDRYHVIYESGTERLYNHAVDLPKTALDWLESHKEQEPEKPEKVGGITAVEPEPDEYQAIQDSMTKTFYEYCTGEKIPDNWKEIVQEERKLKEAAKAVPELQPPAPTGKPGRGAAETVAFSLCIGLAYAVYGAKEMIDLLILAMQALWVTLIPIAQRTWRGARKAWITYYPVIRQTTGETARIAAKQIALAVWYLWIVIA